MRRVSAMFVSACLLLVGAGTATMGQSSSPPPWFGGRVEMSEHGFAVTLPATWAALDPKDDLVAQEEAIRGAWGDTSYVSFAPPNPERNIFVAYAGPGITPRFQSCLISAGTGAAAALRASVAGFRDAIAASDRFAQPPGSIREVDLPAGVAYAIDYELLDGIAQLTTYFVAVEGRVLQLQCGSLEGRPDDVWLPIAETLEFLPAAGAFEPAGSLADARAEHTATLLRDGRVLVVGGQSGGDQLASAEVWDPATASFGPAGSLAQDRVWHTATLLPDGRVLVVGGRGEDGIHASVEVWDPTTASFSVAGSLADARIGHTATLLPDGRVLLIGPLASVAVWDPATGTSSPTGSLIDARGDHTATLLPDGRVLVVGGRGGGDFLASAEVWDSVTGLFGPAGSLIEARSSHTATLLPSGRVLVLGGIPGPGEILTSAELWDPATDSFSSAGLLTEARADHTATLLPDSRVLVVGGFDLGGYGPLASAETWDPATASFSLAGSLAEARDNHTATLLSDGRVLVVGGCCWEEGTSAEVWGPSDG